MKFTRLLKLLPLIIGVVISLCSAGRLRAQESSPGADTDTPAPKSETKSSATAGLKADTDWGGTAELLSVKRGDGGTITMQFKFTNPTDKPIEVSQVGHYNNDNIASLVYYVDPKNRKKYLVIKDEEKKPLSSDMQYLKLAANASKAGWAKFPAPPADVTAITVYLPSAPPFERVPITD